MELVDSSVWGWRERDLDVKRLLDRKIVEDEAGTCDAVRLELLYSARSISEFREITKELDALHSMPIGQAEWRRALEVYQALAVKGGAHQRQVNAHGPADRRCSRIRRRTCTPL